MTTPVKCPCKSFQTYKQCCYPFHKGTAIPTTATELMRSRFSAYALRIIDYIINTTHPESPLKMNNTSTWKKDLLRFSQTTTFENLDILDSADYADHSTVTFHAVLKQGKLDASFTEKSTFYSIDGKWYYHSGATLDSVR